MEIVTVASLAARVMARPLVTITSTLGRTSWATSSLCRASSPSPDHHSIVILLPSKCPRSLSPCRMPRYEPRWRKGLRILSGEFSWLVHRNGKGLKRLVDLGEPAFISIDRHSSHFDNPPDDSTGYRCSRMLTQQGIAGQSAGRDICHTVQA
jgi:hypothetical protein